MDTDDFLDLVLKLGEGLKTVSGTGVTLVRARALQNTQRALGELCRGPARPSWMRAAGSVVLGIGNGYGVLPADFSSFGQDGQVWYTGPSQPYQLKEQPQHVVSLGSTSAVEPSGSTMPRIYCVAEYQRDVGHILEVSPWNTLELELRVTYQKARPTLVDTSGSTNGLDQIPDEWAEDVLMPKVLEFMAVDRNDPGMASLHRTQSQDAVVSMARQIKPAAMRQRMPRFFGRGRR